MLKRQSITAKLRSGKRGNLIGVPIETPLGQNGDRRRCLGLRHRR